MDFLPVKDPLAILAYFLPIVFLAAFAGSMKRRNIFFLAWGFIVAIPAYYLELFLSPAPTDTVGILTLSVTVSPIIEELFIVLPLAIAFAIGIRMNKQEIFACAMTSGIGFSIIENCTVLNPNSGQIAGIGLVAGIMIRSFSSGLMHGCTCAIIGYGLVLIREVHRHALPALFMGFYIVAVMIHALFNLAMNRGWYIADLIFPFCLYLFLLLCYNVDIPLFFRPDPFDH